MEAPGPTDFLKGIRALDAFGEAPDAVLQFVGLQQPQQQLLLQSQGPLASGEKDTSGEVCLVRLGEPGSFDSTGSSVAEMSQTHAAARLIALNL
jgi:hypothetical protein